MKKIALILSIVALGSLWKVYSVAAEPAPQNELLKSYQREILFLSAYKKELQSKLQTVESNLQRKQRKAEKELSSLERKWLGLQTQNELMAQKLTDLERDVDFKKENKESLETTLKQAEMSLPKGTLKDEQSLGEKVTLAFSQSIEQLNQDKKIQSRAGEFFSKSGEQMQGKIVTVGSVARFGVKDGDIAALYPTGGGAFRVWKWLGKDSMAMINGKYPNTLSFFLYEDAEKEFIAEEEKSWFQTVQSGGAVAWIIVLLGGVAVVLSLLRFILLRKSRLQNAAEMEKLLGNVENGDFDGIRDYCLKNSNSVTRVIGKTLAHLKSDPDKVEDAIAEGIVKESQLIDRFGVLIMVIASVAPLLGLLGTVTGMISTFDIITLHGTGNPKLLSGGISEALITTMLGLIVAIPALFVGQYLGSVNESIKSDMEKWALAVCNRFNGGAQS